MRFKRTCLFNAFGDELGRVFNLAIVTLGRDIRHGLFERRARLDQRIGQVEHPLELKVRDDKFQVAVIDGDRLFDQVQT